MIRIVLTGGPQAGKSSIIEKLAEHLEQKGKKVVIVGETAAELIKGGIQAQGDATYIQKFQDLVYKTQTRKEKDIEEFAKNTYDGDNLIILYDRGIIDNKAYLPSQDDFDFLLDKYKAKELKLVSKYDLVLNLLSASNMEDFSYEQNDIRKEDKDWAQEIDEKTTKAWLLHDNLRIISPKVNFDDKIDEVIKTVESYIKGEDKRFCKSIDIDLSASDLSVYDDNNSKRFKESEYFMYGMGGLILGLCEKKYKDAKTAVLKVYDAYTRELKSIEPLDYNVYMTYIDRYIPFDYSSYEIIRTVNDQRQLYEIIINEDGAKLNIYDKDFKMPNNIKIKANIRKLSFNKK